MAGSPSDQAGVVLLVPADQTDRDVVVAPDSRVRLSVDHGRTLSASSTDLLGPRRVTRGAQASDETLDRKLVIGIMSDVI